ncbi:MAG: hypothetical protein H6574_03450 [Lewinellaceae bacterium]|nr:hypothetical protein [Saprospiraceae bacterium]MCB9330114.1 hypothetical protein [Lewinellaceae bacterium]
MNEEALHELIEQYIEGSLPEKERLAVEKRLTTDPDFRAEVQLQRAMYEHLSDPALLHLRETLASVVQQPQSRPAFRWKVHPGLRLVGIAAAFFMLVIAAWWALRSGQPDQAALVAVEQPDTNSKDHLADTPAPQQPVQIPSGQTPQTPSLLVQADPADFATNPTLDARIGNIRGAGNLEVQIDKPLPDDAFHSRNGALPLVFRGTVRADSLAMLLPLRLFLYTNRPEAWTNKKPHWATTILPEPSGSDTFQFHLDQTMRLRPGLYYLVLGQQRGSDISEGFKTIWVGRFSFNAPSKTD